MFVTYFVMSKTSSRLVAETCSILSDRNILSKIQQNGQRDVEEYRNFGQ